MEDIVNSPSGALTPEGARYWMRAAEWRPHQAAWLLLGIDPWIFVHVEIQTDEDEERLDSILGEIRHVEGHSAPDLWCTWTPTRWLEAARKAHLAIPHELNDISSKADPLDKPLREVERRTLLFIIQALADHAEIDTIHHEAAGVIISKLTDGIGAHVPPGTIARHLKKIPGAIQAHKDLHS